MTSGPALRSWSALQNYARSFLNALFVLGS
jgi:hypothetical protein